MIVFRDCIVKQNLHVSRLYHNPDLDDHMFDCLLTSMAVMQDVDVHASFLFVGELNAHHQEWLGSTATNRHCVAAFDFATMCGCDQLFVCQVVEHLTTYARGGTLEIVMTNVTDLR